MDDFYILAGLLSKQHLVHKYCCVPQERLDAKCPENPFISGVFIDSTWDCNPH